MRGKAIIIQLMKFVCFGFLALSLLGLVVIPLEGGEYIEVYSYQLLILNFVAVVILFLLYWKSGKRR